MALTPIDIQKVSFRKKWWGYDPAEVENLLALITEELTAHLEELEKLDRENRYYRQRLQDSQQRESQLQETLIRVQKVSEQITANAEHEGELLVKGAEQKADAIVSRAMDQAAKIESRISELRNARQELFLKFRHTLEFFERIIEAESAVDQQGATIRTLARPRAATADSDQQD